MLIVAPAVATAGWVMWRRDALPTRDPEGPPWVFDDPPGLDQRDDCSLGYLRFDVVNSGARRAVEDRTTNDGFDEPPASRGLATIE